jgi:hypothetical protein
MKRSTFLKSLMIAVTAPSVLSAANPNIVKPEEANTAQGTNLQYDTLVMAGESSKTPIRPNSSISATFNLHMDHQLYTFAMHKCGDPKKAAEFGTWYAQNMKYWQRELKRQGKAFFDSPKQVAHLSKFEGQTFENLWKLYNESRIPQGGRGLYDWIGYKKAE